MCKFKKTYLERVRIIGRQGRKICLVKIIMFTNYFARKIILNGTEHLTSKNFKQQSSQTSNIETEFQSTHKKFSNRKISSPGTPIMDF